MYNYDALWRTMEKRGITTYSLINHYEISSHTMRNIRHNENITMETVNRLCQILHCQASDVIEITFSEEESLYYSNIKTGITDPPEAGLRLLHLFLGNLFLPVVFNNDCSTGHAKLPNVLFLLWGFYGLCPCIPHWRDYAGNCICL